VRLSELLLLDHVLLDLLEVEVLRRHLGSLRERLLELGLVRLQLLLMQLHLPLSGLLIAVPLLLQSLLLLLVQLAQELRLLLLQLNAVLLLLQHHALQLLVHAHLLSRLDAFTSGLSLVVPSLRNAVSLVLVQHVAEQSIHLTNTPALWLHQKSRVLCSRYQSSLRVFIIY